ncbi:putative sulfate exporter family transporter, partial [Bacillus sp. D-CC]
TSGNRVSKGVGPLKNWTDIREFPAPSKEKRSWRDLPIPWFIFGFLAMSAVHSLGIIPEVFAGYIVVIAYMLIAMAMAGLGLNVEFKTFRKLGSKAFVAGLIGSVCLSVLGYVLVYVLSFYMFRFVFNMK